MNTRESAEYFDFEGRSVAWGRVGEGPPLVAVHGTPWSSYNLRHLIAGLSVEYCVYYFDLMGYGRSDQSEGDVSLAIQDRVMNSLLDFWGLERPIALGHDFGGATVLRTRILHERSFEALVLVDPVAISPWGSSFFRHVAEHEEAFRGIPAYMHEAMVRSYIGTAAYRPIPEEVLAATAEPWLGPIGQPALYRQMVQANPRQTEEVEGSYGKITEEVLVLWGEKDAWIPVERGHELTERFPNARLHTIAESGHLVIEEKPEELLSHIRPFLREVRSR